MNPLQEKQLELLKTFVNVCNKHNLTYFLVYGSALGAIRHKGFIPWDDDIDVGMPRKDYEEYIKLQSEYEGTPYFIQTFKSDPCYIYNYAKSIRFPSQCSGQPYQNTWPFLPLQYPSSSCT